MKYPSNKFPPVTSIRSGTCDSGPLYIFCVTSRYRRGEPGLETTIEIGECELVPRAIASNQLLVPFAATQTNHFSGSGDDNPVGSNHDGVRPSLLFPVHYSDVEPGALGFGRPDSFTHFVIVPEDIWLCQGTDIKPMNELVSQDATDKNVRVCENEANSLGVVSVVRIAQNGSRTDYKTTLSVEDVGRKSCSRSWYCW